MRGWHPGLTADIKFFGCMSGNRSTRRNVVREMNQESKVMGKTVITAFAFAVLVILSASIFAPRSVAHSSNGCAPAYGVDPCALQAAN